MTVSILHLLWRELTYLLNCRRPSLVSGIQNDIVELSCEEWLKYTDLTLAYILDHAGCCASPASLGWSLHLIISQLRTKYSLLNCPNHVQWTKSSIKKWIIVRQTVLSMFSEKTNCPNKNGLKTLWLYFQSPSSSLKKSFWWAQPAHLKKVSAYLKHAILFCPMLIWS